MASITDSDLLNDAEFNRFSFLNVFNLRIGPHQYISHNPVDLPVPITILSNRGPVQMRFHNFSRKNMGKFTNQNRKQNFAHCALQIANRYWTNCKKILTGEI